MKIEQATLKSFLDQAKPNEINSASLGSKSFKRSLEW